MATPRKGDKPRHAVNHQVWWQDLEAWVEQLWEEFGGQVDFSIKLPSSVHSINPAVCLTITKRGVGREQRVLYEDWGVFRWAESGHCEKVALQLISKALLTLEHDRDVSERMAQLPLA